jgi:hypothetical protein
MGLAAAAAVRWLNGGDFHLLPSATRQVLPDRSNDESLMVVEMQTDVQELKESVERQDRTLKRLTADIARHHTNESMERLRYRNDSSNTTAAAKLSEIHMELSRLRRDLKRVDDCSRSNDWNTQLSDTLQRLQACMDQMAHDNQSTKQTVALHVVERSASTSIETITSIPDNNSASDDKCSDENLTMEQAIRRLVEENDRDHLQAGAQLLFLYVTNLCSNPRVPRYRKIFTTNDSFKKVNAIKGGRDLLLSLNFVEKGNNCLEWLVSAEEEGPCLERLARAAATLKILKSSQPDDSRLGTSFVAADWNESSAGTATPPPSPLQESNGSTDQYFPSAAMQTPELGSILSPPVTKKQIFSNMSEFPSLDPLSTPALNAGDVATNSTEPEASAQSPPRDGTDDETDAMWK